MYHVTKIKLCQSKWLRALICNRHGLLDKFRYDYVNLNTFLSVVALFLIVSTGLMRKKYIDLLT